MPTAPTERVRVRRVPARAVYDREAIHAILDEGLVAHLAFVHDGQPYAIPTLHARVGETLYVHGSAASRAIRTLRAGAPACLTVTLLDGFVLARSAFHHSVNYRSVVVSEPRCRWKVPRSAWRRWRRSPKSSFPVAGARCGRPIRRS